MSWNPEDETKILAEIRDVLAELFPTEADAQQLVHDAKINSRRIAFSANASNNWFAILREAKNSNRVHLLLDEARRAYPENLELRTLSEVYLKLKRQRPHNRFIVTPKKSGIYGPTSKNAGRLWRWTYRGISALIGAVLLSVVAVVFFILSREGNLPFNGTPEPDETPSGAVVMASPAPTEAPTETPTSEPTGTETPTNTPPPPLPTAVDTPVPPPTFTSAPATLTNTIVPVTPTHTPGDQVLPIETPTPTVIATNLTDPPTTPPAIDSPSDVPLSSVGGDGPVRDEALVQSTSINTTTIHLPLVTVSSTKEPSSTDVAIVVGVGTSSPSVTEQPGVTSQPTLTTSSNPPATVPTTVATETSTVPTFVSTHTTVPLTTATATPLPLPSTETSTLVPTDTPAPAFTGTPLPTFTPTHTPTYTPSPTETPVPTETPTWTPSPTVVQPTLTPIIPLAEGGLVGWWNCASGDARDQSGNGHDGQLMDGATCTDIDGRQAFALDGVNDFVEIPTLDDVSLNSFTIVLSFKLDEEANLQETNSRIVHGLFQSSAGEESGEAGQNIQIANQDNPVAGPNLHGGYRSATDGGASSLRWEGPQYQGTQKNKWYHVALRRDAELERGSFWVDGLQVSAAKETHFDEPPIGTVYPIQLGRSFFAPSGIHTYLRGYITDVRIYNRPLTDTEIRQQYLDSPRYDCSTVSEIPQAECEVLVSLYDSTNGSHWIDASGWLQVGKSPCSWFGVTCEQGHVAALKLNNNRLTGEIPSELGGLSRLKTLVLSNNQLTGEIPTALGSLGDLVLLHLSTNKLSGGIPRQLGQLGNLQSLQLHNNYLEGEIPPELGNLTWLDVLILYSNRLTGTIPAQLGQLTNLERFDLNTNDLSGELPDELGNLIHLTGFTLYDNPDLTGPIPQTFTQLTKLRLFAYNKTELCEPSNPEFQAWLAGIEQVSGTGIPCTPTTPVPSFCTTVTDIPSGECEALIALYNATNGENWGNNAGWLTSANPCEWYGITCQNGKVTTLALSENNLSGSLPNELSALSELTSIFIFNNPNLTGGLNMISNMVKLQEINIYGNGHEGAIPDLSKLQDLQVLWLASNNLNGEIPNLSMLQNLREVHLGGNGFAGFQAGWEENISILSNLTFFVIAGNPSLAGEFPLSMMELEKLENFSVENTLVSCPDEDPNFQEWLKTIEHFSGNPNCQL